jgi:4-amino-4-deoxy-L-arabinose transferase-like glycosyltransferase
MSSSGPSQRPSPLSDETAGDPAKSFRRLALILLVLGVTFRLVLFLLCHPLYEDEAFLALNLVDRGYLELTRQLDRFQVAPVLFLWTELTAYRLGGASEWVLRLVPLLAGLASLGLFWHLARLTVSPMAATLAVGLLAVSRWPVHLSCQVKPYSLDLLASLALLTVTIHWLQRPDRIRWLVALTCLAPLALATSYPAVFVAGSISIVLFPVVWRRSTCVRLLYLGFNALVLAGFFLCDVVIAQRQLGPSGSAFQTYMTDFWHRGFPPADPGRFLGWLLMRQVGPLMGYPYGNGTVPGLLTFPLFLFGAYLSWKRGQRSFVAVCLLPFVLTLLAAVLGRYPYGACSRLSQHLAPLICLLTGVGSAGLVALWARTPRLRVGAVGAICGALAVFGLVCLANWTVHPFRGKEDMWGNNLACHVRNLASNGERIVILNSPMELDSPLHWYLLSFDTPVEWATPGERFRLPERAEPMWLLHYSIGTPPALADRLEEVPAWTQGQLLRTHRLSYQLDSNTRFPRFVELWRVTPRRADDQ